MTWRLKCDSEFTQAGAGLEAVRETVPVSDSSRENEFMWYLVLEYGTKKFRFLVSVR